PHTASVLPVGAPVFMANTMKQSKPANGKERELVPASTSVAPPLKRRIRNPSCPPLDGALQVKMALLDWVTRKVRFCGAPVGERVFASSQAKFDTPASVGGLPLVGPTM